MTHTFTDNNGDAIATSGTTITALHPCSTGGLSQVIMYIKGTGGLPFNISNGTLTNGTNFFVMTPIRTSMEASNERHTITLGFQPTTTSGSPLTDTFTITIEGTEYVVTVSGVSAAADVTHTVLDGLTPGYGTPTNRVAPCAIVAHWDPTTSHLPAPFGECYFRWVVTPPNAESFDVVDRRKYTIGTPRDLFEHYPGCSVSIPVKEGEDGEWKVQLFCHVPGDVDGIASLSSTQETITVDALSGNRTVRYVTVTGDGAHNGTTLGNAFDYSEMRADLSNDKHYIFAAGTYDFNGQLDLLSYENISIVGAGDTTILRRITTNGIVIDLDEAKGGWIQDVKIEPLAILTTPVNITVATWTGGVATITAGTHLLSNGDFIDISGMTPPEYDGRYVATKLDADNFTYVLDISDPGAGSAFGAVSEVKFSDAIFSNNTSNFALYDISFDGDGLNAGGFHVGNSFGDNISLGNNSAADTPKAKWTKGLSIIKCHGTETRDYSIVGHSAMTVEVDCLFKASTNESCLRSLGAAEYPIGTLAQPRQDRGFWLYNSVDCRHEQIGDTGTANTKQTWRLTTGLFHTICRPVSIGQMWLGMGASGSSNYVRSVYDMAVYHGNLEPSTQSSGMMLSIAGMGVTLSNCCINRSIAHFGGGSMGMRELTKFINCTLSLSAHTGSLINQVEGDGGGGDWYGDATEDRLTAEFQSCIIVSTVDQGNNWFGDSGIVSGGIPLRGPNSVTNNIFPLDPSFAADYAVNGADPPYTSIALLNDDTAADNNIALDITLDSNGRPVEDATQGRDPRSYFDYWMKDNSASDTWAGMAQSETPATSPPPASPDGCSLLLNDGELVLLNTGDSIFLNQDCDVAIPISISHTTLDAAEDIRKYPKSRPVEELNLSISIPIRGNAIALQSASVTQAGLVKSSQSIELPTIRTAKSTITDTISMSGSLFSTQKTIATIQGTKNYSIPTLKEMTGIREIMQKRLQLDTLKELLRQLDEDN